MAKYEVRFGFDKGPVEIEASDVDFLPEANVFAFYSVDDDSEPVFILPNNSFDYIRKVSA